MTLDRRSFVKFLGVSPSLLPSFSLSGASTRPGSLSAMPSPRSPDPPVQLPFRHIHQDFHTSPAITAVAEDFRADEYAQTLKDAAVNSITVFAKCQHGMSYYPTKVGNPNAIPKRTINERFNTAAYQIPSFGTVGTAGKHTLYTDPLVNWDSAFFKRWPFGGDRDVEFRGGVLRLLEPFHLWYSRNLGWYTPIRDNFQHSRGGGRSNLV